MRISVAVCTYNGAKYIYEQLKSIENQSRKVDEIVVCDDISTDDTWRILSDFKAQTDIPTVLIKNEQQKGVMYNFQQAIETCTGDIILLSDQDDIWLPDKSAFFENYFIYHQKTNLLFSNAELLLEGYSETDIKVRTLFELLNFRERTQEAFRKGFGLEVSQILGRISGFTVGIRARLKEQVIPFVPKYEYFIHDRQMALYAIQQGSIDFTTECLTQYRLHKEQTSNIYEYLKRHSLLPAQDELFTLPPIGADVIDYLKTRGFTSEHLEFSKERTDMIKSFVGVVLILSKIKKYKRHYKGYSKKVIWEDCKSSVKDSYHRMYKKIKL